MEKEKTRFNELSGWVKLGIIGGWIVLFIYVISFLIGFTYGLLGL